MPSPPFQFCLEPPCPILDPQPVHGLSGEYPCSREHCPQIMRLAHTPTDRVWPLVPILTQHKHLRGIKRDEGGTKRVAVKVKQGG